MRKSTTRSVRPVGPPRETYRLMLVFGEVSGSTPNAADGAMLKRLRNWGYSSQAIEDGLRGVQAMLDGNLALPEGALSWCKRPFGVALLLYRTNGRRVVDLAGDAWRAAQPKQERTGLNRLTVGRL